MKNAPTIIAGIFATLLIIFAGCTGAPVKFNTATMSEQPYDAARGIAISGQACGLQAMTFFPIRNNSRAKRAYDDLIKQAPSDKYIVTNVMVQEAWYFAGFGIVYCTEMQATAYPKISAGTASERR